MGIALEGAEPLGDGRSWRLGVAPSSLSVFKAFADDVRGHSTRDLIFRGQMNSEWKINSTFARRDLIQDWIKTPAGLELAYKELGAHLFNALPSDELEIADRDSGLDSYFELHRMIQQHPEKFDARCRETGTMLVDWSQCFRVALAFACEVRSNEPSRDGVFYVLDPKGLEDWSWPRKTVEAYATLYSQLGRGQVVSPPMILRYPQKQKSYPRVERQKPVYTMQVDITCPHDLAAERMEKLIDPATGSRTVALHRVLIPSWMKPHINEQLAADGITLDWLLDR